MRRARETQAGLSLIELVVAMALFALVAVMGAQGLTGMLRMRDDLGARSAATADLARTLSLMRADLSAALPMPFFTPGDGPVRSALAEEPEGFSLSVGGQPVLIPARRAQPVLQRVEWRLEAGTNRLMRRQWDTLMPLDSSARSPEIVVMEGVTGLRLRSYWGAETGWRDGVRPPGLTSTAPSGADGDGPQVAGSAFSSTLPEGVEIMLISETYGEIPLLEALR